MINDVLILSYNLLSVKTFYWKGMNFSREKNMLMCVKNSMKSTRWDFRHNQIETFEGALIVITVMWEEKKLYNINLAVHTISNVIF